MPQYKTNFIFMHLPTAKRVCIYLYVFGFVLSLVSGWDTTWLLKFKSSFKKMKEEKKIERNRMGEGKKCVRTHNSNTLGSWHLAWLHCARMVECLFFVSFSNYMRSIDTRCFGSEGHIRFGTRKITKKQTHTQTLEGKHIIKESKIV